jgi:hypothetical protein
MSWTLTWSWVAEHRDFYALHLHAAERIDAALLRLADTGRGPMTQDPDNPNTFRLRVKGAEAQLFLDRKARVIYVVRVHRR